MNNREFSTQMKKRIYEWTVRLVKYLRILAKQRDRAVWVIVDQLMRSGTSVGGNYIEAIAAPSSKDFRNYVANALKSANELKYWLALIRDTAIDQSEELQWLLREMIEIANILGKSVSTMYNKD